MTRDEIIKLAREAGLAQVNTEHDLAAFVFRFAALVAAAERERIAAEFDRRAVYSDGTPLYWYKPHEPAEIVRSMK